MEKQTLLIEQQTEILKTYFAPVATSPGANRVRVMDPEWVPPDAKPLDYTAILDYVNDR